MTKIRPPVKWHGGKHYLAKRIVAEFHPLYEHMTYVEPYGGAASVLLNKKPSHVEVYNDIDGDLVNLFRTLRGQGLRLAAELHLTPYSEAEFHACRERALPNDPVERARQFIVQCRQSIGGRGDAFSETLHRSRRGMADVVSGYLSSIDEELPRIIERLRCVQITKKPAIRVIRRYDSENTLFYLDPPYMPCTRSARTVYRHEMSVADHRILLRRCLRCEGSIAISGYSCRLYERLLADWRKVEFDMPNHSARGRKKKRRAECLWMNY